MAFVRPTRSLTRALTSAAALAALSLPAALADVTPALAGPVVPLSPAAVTASGSDGNAAGNVLDGDLSTRWSAKGDGQWITLDLGAPHRMSGVDVAWYRGDERSADFEVETSLDGASWTRVHAGSSSGATLERERYDLDPGDARWVRLVGYGNSSGNGWNSVTELAVVGTPRADADRAGDTAADDTGTGTGTDAGVDALVPTLFVRPDGDDDADGTDPDEAFATVQRAVDDAGPGDVILLADGVYRQDVVTVRDGRADAPITITGSRDAVVVGAGSSRIVQVSHDHVHLRGFTIDGLHGDPGSRSGYRDKLVYAVGERRGDGVTGLRILDMALRNAGGEAVRVKYLARDVEIARSEIVGTGIWDFRFGDGGKNGEGVYVGTSPKQLDRNPDDRVDTTADVWIHHNYLETANEGVNVKEGASRVIVEHNTVTGQVDPGAAGINVQGEDSVVRFNDVHGNVGAGVRLGASTPTDDGVERGVRNAVYGNRLHDNAAGGVKVMSWPQDVVCGNDVTGRPSAGRYDDRVDPLASCRSDVPTSPGSGHLAGR